MALLSSPLTKIQAHYDVVVVGSGYGGSIAASRLARARKADGSPVRVALLERGREIPVGEFPDSIPEAVSQFQVDIAGKRVGRRDALYFLRANDDMSVFQGCGLGGTSLVNANVSLPPDQRVWEDPRWPEEIRQDLEQGITEGFERAIDMLRPTPYPVDGPDRQPTLSKYQALVASARAMGRPERVYNPPINVNFKTQVNHVGVEQEACDGCGDCVSGCNRGAKNTLMMNYLPDARNQGAEIFCSVEVRRVAQAGEGWAVYYRPAACDRDKFDAPDMRVTAEVVVVSAGTLGSNEILLRSKAQGLPCSDRLGERFTGNGDVLGFGYNNDVPISGIGTATRKPTADDPVGPCITGIIDLRDSDKLEDGYVVEEGTLPGAMATVLPAAFKAARILTGSDTDQGLWDKIKERTREFTSLVFGAYKGAVRNTQTYLIMSHDDAGGRLKLEDDRVVVKWPGIGKHPLFGRLGEVMTSATRATGGTFVPSPLFNRFFGYDLITVHPLGGCAIAPDAGQGVINHQGQMFAATQGTAVHEGLYVSDGAIMPRPLGVNPLLTISALTERNVKRLAGQRGWQIDYALSGEKARYDGRREAGEQIHLQFTEKMAGHCSTTVLEDYAQAEAHGKETDSPCAFVLTIMTEDLDRMLEEPHHEAALVGTVEVPALSREAMTTYGGKFNLFEADDREAGVRKMRYRMGLSSVEGQRYYFEGYKTIRDDEGLDVWDDTTTLYITLHKGEDDTAPVVAKGMLHIAKSDFARQMTTMSARDARGGISLAGQARFGKFFAGQLWETYGANG